MIDASAVVAALVHTGNARERLANDALHAPHLLDSEVIDVLRRMVMGEVVARTDAERAMSTWSRIAVSRYPTIGMLDRIWELRHNVSAYDAAYIALAEHLDCHVVTADQRLAGATGPRCTIELVPR